jgi:hypothetical protein
MSDDNSTDTPTTVGDLDGDRYVWKSTNRGGGGTLSIHLHPDCRHLHTGARRVRARTEFAFRALCLTCVARGCDDAEDSNG